MAAQGVSRQWVPSRVFGPFYSGGTAIYESQHHVIFCLYGNCIAVVDAASGVLVANTKDIGDPIVEFAISGDGSTVVSGCASFLFRVWSLDWTRIKNPCKESTNVMVDCGDHETMDGAVNGDVGETRNPVVSTLVRSWKVS